MTWKTLGLGAAILLSGNSVRAQSTNGLPPEMEHEFVEAGRIGHGGVERAKVENHLQAKHGMAAFVTRDSLYIIPLSGECTLPICGSECMAYARVAHALALPGTREAQPPAMGLIRAIRSLSESRVVVVVARAGGILHRMEIRIADGAVKDVKRTAINLGSFGDESVRAFGDAREISAAAPEGFLVFGTGGLLRRVDEAPDGSMTEFRFSHSNTEDFVAYGNGWVGTGSGQIWKVVSLTKAPYAARFQHPTLEPIVRIDFMTAFMANGQYLVFRAGGWFGPYGIPGVALGAHPRFSLAGTTMRVYSERGMADTLIGDSPGHMPGAPFKALKYTGQSAMSFDLVLRDSDRNMKRPSFALFHSDFGSELAREFVDADPNLGCAETGTCLPGLENTLTVNLTEDSVFLSVPVLKGKSSHDAVCNRPAFEGKAAVFTTAQGWGNGSSLTLAVGKDTVRIQYGEPVGIRLSGVVPDGRKSVRREAGMLFPAFGRDGVFFDAAGRMDPAALRMTSPPVRR